MRKGQKNTRYVCTECGHTSTKWLGKCSSCGGWNTMVEETIASTRTRASTLKTNPIPLSRVRLGEEERISTGLEEMDRVLGGGLVPGTLVLLGGEPGIGKSTLLLQILMQLCKRKGPCLYVTGEESPEQIKMRASRIDPRGTEVSERLLVVSETDLQAMEDMIQQIDPEFLAVDSVQTLYCPGVPSAPGSIAQVRESTVRIMELSKLRGMSTFLIGHVTKEGAIAGPRVLEHLVDTVLYFEGDRSHSFRLLRTVKNRYGPTNEIGVFEMTAAGLMQVPNPSEVFMAQRPKGLAGSVVVPCMEGTRPILAEIQALVSPSHLTMPRRTASGVDGNRLALLIAVMEKYLDVTLYNRDIFVKVAGGLKLSEPGADLAIVMAIISSCENKALDPDTAVIGEIGLTGEVRPVGRMDARLKEASRLGLGKCIVPESAMDRLKPPKGMKPFSIRGVHQVKEILA